MDDLAHGVHSGVSPPAGCRGVRIAGQLLEGVLKGLLDGAQPGLALPSMKIGSVVAESQHDVAHRHTRPGGRSKSVQERGTKTCALPGCRAHREWQSWSPGFSRSLPPEGATPRY